MSARAEEELDIRTIRQMMLASIALLEGHLALTESDDVPLNLKHLVAAMYGHAEKLGRVACHIADQVTEQLIPPNGLDVEAAARIHDLEPNHIRCAILAGKLPARGKRLSHWDLIRWIGEGCPI